MKRILYLTNYMDESVLRQRNNRRIYSQPANIKVMSMRRVLEACAADVRIVSTGLVNNRSAKWYRGYESSETPGVAYCGIFDLPLVNSITAIITMFAAILREHRREKIDNIVFYNFKPEIAWPAYLAKHLLKIPITVEYEDGYSGVEGFSAFKRSVFMAAERTVSRSIDSAVVVTSLLEDKFPVPTAVFRGLPSCTESHAVQKQPGEKTRLLYCGGLDIERGIRVALESMRFLDDSFELCITGKGVLEHEVRAAAQSDARIKYLGFLPYEQVLENMRSSDILLQCQLERHDFGAQSFPSKLFEYMAAGDRIVSSRVSDVEIFAQGGFYLYGDDDPAQLAAAVIEARDDILSGSQTRPDIVRRVLGEQTAENIALSVSKIL